MKHLNYKLLNEYASHSPNAEHTQLIEVEDLKNNPEYFTYRFGNEPSDRPLGNIVAIWRDEDNELMITQTRALSHEDLVASSGAGKSQGPIIGSIMTMHPNMSGLFFDPKGELCSATYERSCETYGKDNVSVINLMQPKHTIDFFNPFYSLAKKWEDSKKENNRQQIRDEIVGSINKIMEQLCKITTQKDPTWERIARDFLMGIIVAFFEDLDLTERQSRRFGRSVVKPEQINFANIYKVYQTFRWDRKFEDNGFLTKRDKNSLAYQLTHAVIDNATSTRANYLQFVNTFLKNICLPNILEISRYNTFDILDYSKKPKVTYIIYDLANESMREFVNFMVSQSINDLLEYTHKEIKPLSIPVMVIADEFPTLLPSSTYSNLLATGRGSGVFMTMVCQSFSQLSVRYGDEAIAMQDNCNVQIFEGTNDSKTAETFAKNLGYTTICDPEAFLMGQMYKEKTVPVVSQDYLLHRMKKSEAFVKINNSLPLHSHFELYYKTPEFLKYPKKNPSDFTPKKVLFNEEYCYELMRQADDDDDDFFLTEDTDEEKRASGSDQQEKKQNLFDYSVYIISEQENIPGINYQKGAGLVDLPVNVFKIVLMKKNRPICENMGYFSARKIANKLTELGFISIVFNEGDGDFYELAYSENDKEFESVCMKVIEAVILIDSKQSKAEAENKSQCILQIAQNANVKSVSVFERVVRELQEAGENTFLELKKILFKNEE